jgi:hypothetical protein
MLNIFRQKLGVELKAAECRELDRKLSAKYSPLILGVKKEYLKKLGFPPEEEDSWIASGTPETASPLLGGDIYIADGSGTILYYKVMKGGGGIEAGVVSNGETAPHVGFFDALRDAVNAMRKDFKGEWEPFGMPAEILKLIVEGSQNVKPTPQEVQGARELENPFAKELLDLVKNSESTFMNKLAQMKTKADTTKYIERFAKLGLINKDFAVLCKRTGQQILRVSSRSAIEQSSQKSFKCFVCGNPISEESVDEIITCSDFGRKLLESDYWLLVTVLGTLEAVGIKSDDINIHMSEKGLINLFININQQSFLVVLVNRKLTLDEAYIIGAEVAAYGIQHQILVSTQKISTLMKSHLERTSPDCDFSFLDSLKSLEGRLRRILREKDKKFLYGIVEPYSDLTPFKIHDMLIHKIAPEPKFIMEEVEDIKEPAWGEEEIPAVEVPAAAPQN